MNGHEFLAEHGKEIIIGGSVFGGLALLIAGILAYTNWDARRFIARYEEEKEEATERVIRNIPYGR